MAAAAEHSFRWAGRELTFSLRRAEVTRLRIEVHPDGTIAVVAPAHADSAAVIRRIEKRAPWIANQLDRFERWRPRTPPRQYVNGETHLFLGRQLRLKVVLGDGDEVRVDGDRLRVQVGEFNSRDTVARIVRQWFAEQAKSVLHERCREQLVVWRRHGVSPPGRVIVRELTNRWGSLTPSGALVLNSDLVRASPKLIDYVIGHELAHARYPDHGPQWRKLLTAVMPDWVERKDLLERQLL
jgi:predicted metal-dependent hydrolase